MALRLVIFALTVVAAVGIYCSGHFTATEYAAAGLFALLSVIAGGWEGRRASRKSAGR